MRHWVADKLTRIANWLDGSGWDYDEFDHGYREGMKVALCRQRVAQVLGASKST